MPRLPFLATSLVFLEFVVPVPARSAQLLVEPDGTGLFATIQDAVDYALPGDTILLTDGVYQGAGNRDIDFGGRGLHLRSQSGDRSACIIDVGASSADPHRAFVFRNGETAAACVRSISIRGGVAFGTVWPAGSGGAVLSTDGSSPTFVDCVFEGNTASIDGGAISCRESTVQLYDCRLEGNSATFGGALFVDQPCLLADPEGSFTPPPTVLERCQWVGNGAADGGAIYAKGIHTTLVVTDSRLEGNLADRGGAAKLHGAAGIFDHCVLAENWAGEEGGALSLESTLFCRPEEDPGRGEDGGAFAVQLSACAFLANSAGFSGGAIFVLGNEVSMTRCTLALNGAPLGSGIHARAVYADHVPSTLAVANTILAFGLDGEALGADSLSAVEIHCSDLFGNAGGDWVGEIADQMGSNGNLCEDPLFCDLVGGDLGLHADSPCAAAPGACGLIGAYPAGCGPSGAPGGPDVSRSDRWLTVAPNPFVEGLRIELELPDPGPVRLRLLDAAGRVAALQVVGPLERGVHVLDWTPRIPAESSGAGRGDRATAGLYFLRAETPSGVASRKIIRLR